MDTTIHPATRLVGEPKIPGDKSISHRSLMFGALADGETTVMNLLESGDVFSSWACLEAMGAQITRKTDKTIVVGKGRSGLQAPTKILDCGNSGTTMRLLMGILAGQNFTTRMTGDDSLRKRPMKRIADPLTRMGARFELTDGQFAPLTVHGAARLKALEHTLPVASAQLKSAILLGGIFADGKTVLKGMIQSRDHTERLLPHFGVKVTVTPESISILGGQRLTANHVNVPGDLSTAAFWLGAAALVKDSQIRLENISLNPTRTGFLEVLSRMGARFETQLVSKEPEWVGNLKISTAKLKGTKITPEEVPSLIDELPLIAVLGARAEGVTEVRGAEELRVKESDRIEAVAQGIRAMGGTIDTFKDGFSIKGPQKLKGAKIDSKHDHRIAMAFSIAGLVADGPTEILHSDCVGISYPAFYSTLKELLNG